MHVNNTVAISRANTIYQKPTYIESGATFQDLELENIISDFSIENNQTLNELLSFTIATIRINDDKIEVNIKPFEGRTHSVDRICEILSMQIKSYLDNGKVFISKN